MSDWIKNKEHKRPLDDNELVDVLFMDGSRDTNRVYRIEWREFGNENDVIAYRPHNQGAATSEQQKPKPKPNKYSKQVNGASIDVYDVLMAWNVTNPAVQHAIKKLLQPGNRGHKDKLTDLSEARDSIIRAIELESK